MDDPTRGLYGKFRIHRVDGTDKPGGKHDGCSYFALDTTHDPYALPALRAYAKSCEATHPRLSSDLTCVADNMEFRGVKPPGFISFPAAQPTWSPTAPTRGKFAAWRRGSESEPVVVLLSGYKPLDGQWHELPD